jgi:2-succinyl-6-hydroxy-2,4-cyclohexadiene-1-carboxylate synthase
MILQVENIALNLLLDEKKRTANKIPIIFLHGFTGCAEDWQFIIDKLPQKFYPVAIDLIGHGKSSSPEDQKYYSTEAITCQINKVITTLQFEKVIIVGYSMGGRAAISYCCRYPAKISAAILESSTAGIENFDQKKERVELDLLLSERIKLEGVEKFLEYWFSIPLFESLKEIDNIEQVKNQRNYNTVNGLSNMLAGFSTGLMPNYWDRIGRINFPVLLISGSLDDKYTEINSRMHQLIINSEHKIASGFGHNVHLENPELFINFTNEFLNKTFPE